MKKRFKSDSNYSLAHVLYQKLGNDWYAFTEMDGDCFMSKVDAKVVDQKNVVNNEPGDKEYRPGTPKRRAA
jgi:hypothetical protein